MKLALNKIYSFNQLQDIFNIHNKSGSQTIKEISKKYLIEKINRGNYKIIRELTDIEQLEVNRYFKNRDYIEPLIYSMLSMQKDNSVTMDMHQIMENIAVVNKDFHYIKYHISECAEVIGLDNKSSLGIFTKESEPLLKKIIRDVIYDMQDKQLIKINEIPIVAYKVIDYDTKQWHTKNVELVSSTDVEKLLEIKRNILQEVFHLEKESELSYFDVSKYRDLIAEKYDANYFFYRYNIILNTKGIKECSNVAKLKSSFNKYIQDKLKKSKQGGLKYLTEKEKDICNKYCISTEQDFMLRYKKPIDKNEEM